jgi:predicted DNA-binding transcriptional regulator AlpA
MVRQSALPPTLPPRLISRDAAAEYVGVSPNTFDVMRGDGRMPPPRRLTVGRLAWDVRELDLAIDRLPIEGEADATEHADTDRSAQERFDAARKAAKAKKVAPQS